MPSNYTVENTKIEDLLGWIREGRIGIPEMQRPFVWKTSKVRDLIDSLYKGYPIGYIVTWQNAGANLKDNKSSVNKVIIIDGQQRLTALRAAISGEPIITKKYERKRIKISFKPSTEEFATMNGATHRDPLWIDDIAYIFSSKFQPYSYVAQNAETLGMEPNKLGAAIQNLINIKQRQIGNIELGSHLSIGAVTDIFNRINSKGVSLSSADLAMSRLSADTQHGGTTIRKQIEYFVELLKDPTILHNIEKTDPEFGKSPAFKQISWITSETDPVYKPEYADLLHVILALQFHRGKLSDLVSLISGRDFQARNYTEESMGRNYKSMAEGVSLVLNQSRFRRFLMILKNIGMLNSGKFGILGKGSLNFGYILYLYLRSDTDLSEEKIDSLVARWIVMSTLTGRYGSSAESRFESDIRLISGFTDTAAGINNQLNAILDDSFWANTLPNNLIHQTTQTNSWRIYQMAQVFNGDYAWLSKNTHVKTVMQEEGNIHHIFPQAYLKRNGFAKKDINQLATLVWVTQPKNLEISDQSPKDYMHDPEVTTNLNHSNNLENAIPDDLSDLTYHDYRHFLEERRQLMADKIHQYYDELG